MSTKAAYRYWLMATGVVLCALVAVSLLLLSRLKSKPLPILAQVPAFSLTNQVGRIVSKESLHGKIWLADLIFTRCAGPCPLLTRALKGIQEQIPAGEPVRLISVTADPEYDTPQVLQRYALRFGADTNSWDFLTGTRPQIRHLVVDGLKLVLQQKAVAEQESPEDLFLHSTRIVLVDQSGRMRATYDGLTPQSKGRILQDIESLLREG